MAADCYARSNLEFIVLPDGALAHGGIEWPAPILVESLLDHLSLESPMTSNEPTCIAWLAWPLLPN